MAVVLNLISVAHWEQNGQLSAQHIRGEHSNVIEYESQEDLFARILDRFSFAGNTAVNLTGDTTNGEQGVFNRPVDYVYTGMF